MSKRKKIWSWVFPTALILFLCEILTLPLILLLTYAGRSESPDHMLTLKNDALTWNAATDVRSDGSAELSLFDAYYQNVNSDDGGKVFAPGTAATRIIRLKNENGAPAKYTAFLYEIRGAKELPVYTVMESADGMETEEYRIPDMLKDATVRTVLTGTVEKDAIADFDISWKWTYEVDGEHDEYDTKLGNWAAQGDAEELTVGFYIVMEGDGGEPIVPDPPKTGENTMLYAFIALIAICGVVLILSFIGRRKEKEEI